MSNVPNKIYSICKYLWRGKNAIIESKSSLPGVPLYLWLILFWENTILSLVQLQGQSLEPLTGCELAMPPSKLRWDQGLLHFKTLLLIIIGWQYYSDWRCYPSAWAIFFSDILQLKMISKVKNRLWESAQVKCQTACRQLAGAKREIVRNY